MCATARSALFVVAFACLAPSLARAQWTPPGPQFPYPNIGLDNLRGSVRVEVDRKDAEVYVDGYYAGVVDDFDGTFQRLHVTAGAHQIVIWLTGFRSIAEDVYLRPDATHRIRQTLVPLAQGDLADPKPVPIVPPGAGAPVDYPPGGAPEPQPPASRPQPSDARRAEPSGSGVLVIRVHPDAADILIDGEPWQGPAGDERLVVQLSEGLHNVEIRKSGFRTFSTAIRIDRGETVPLNVSLSRN